MQVPTLAIDTRFTSPQSLRIALPRLEQDTKAFGFYHDAKNPNVSISKAYLHRDPISASGYIDWPDYDREFQLGQAIDFTFVSRELFRSSDGEGQFPIILEVMTGNSIKGGALGIYCRTNLCEGYSVEYWWAKVERALSDMAMRIHQSFDSERTILYWDEPEGDLCRPAKVLLELAKGDKPNK